MKAITAILLAGGKGTRMKSKKQKVLHDVCGRPLISWVIKSVQKSIRERPVAVVGYDAQSVMEHLGKNARYATQSHIGSVADAVKCAVDTIEDERGYVLVLAGNLPLINSETVHALAQAAEGNAASRLIYCHEDGEVCISTAYCFEIRKLRECIAKNPEAKDAEQYIKYLRKNEAAVIDIYGQDVECMDVVSRADLWECNCIMQRYINQRHMDSGVSFIDPNASYIGADVRIGMDTVIYPNVILEGSTAIGENCVIYPGCRFTDVIVGNRCTLQAVVGQDAVVDSDCKIGPYVRLRPNAHLKSGCKIGNFVEIKNSTLGSNGKIAHLTYVGDADVGNNINIGCGCVFANYDDFDKHRTKVGDNVFLGCQTALVAPVKVGNDVYTAAGSTITEDVPDGALAIGRSRQVNKPGWVEEFRGKHKK